MRSEVVEKALQSARTVPDLPRAQYASGGGIDTPGAATDFTTPRPDDLGLYSHGAVVAAKMPMAKGSPQQIKGYLLKNGVKPDEFKHSGYDEKLGGKPVVTREEVAQHFHRGMPKLSEAVLGGIDDGESEDHPRYREYTLPGGKNYREHLLKYERPKRTDLPPGYRVAPTSELPPNLRGGGHRYAVVGPAWGGGPGEGSFGYGHTPQIAIDRANQTIGREEGGIYQTSHWEDHDNVLLHRRLSDRFDKAPTRDEEISPGLKVTKHGDRAKMLHLEEMQSDWAQQGREKGFRNALTSEEYKEGAGYSSRGAQNLTPEELTRWRELTDRHHASQEALPRAPYVDSTSKWLDLGLKRTLHDAAKGGYSKLLITPGEEQAKRYDLSKHIDALHVHGYPSEPGVVSLSMKPIGSREFTEGGHNSIPHAELGNHIGKDLAERIIKDREAHDPTRGTFSKEYSGLDLKVGGEGMKTFYDQMLPRALEKLAQRHDPDAKVHLHGHALHGTKSSDGAKASDVAVMRDMNIGTTRWDRMSYIEQQLARLQHQRPTHVHSLEITPKMRASILKGQPHFESGGTVRAYAAGGAVIDDDLLTTHPHDMTPEQLGRWDDHCEHRRQARAEGGQVASEPAASPDSSPGLSVSSLSSAFSTALNHHLSLPMDQRIANSKTAAGSVAETVGWRKDGKPVPLLGRNMKLTKTVKGYKGGDPVTLPNGQPIQSAGLALAPAYSKGKFTTCPNSASCKTSCLGKTSGGYQQFGGGKDLDAVKGPRLNSVNKTEAMFRDPHSFAVRLNDEIEAAKRTAARKGAHLGIRLNVLSDLHPRILEPIIKAHPNVSFYDYTKLNADPIAPNHHYTYSSTGISQPKGTNGIKEDVINPHSNWKSMRKRLDTGSNVAMSFSHKSHLPETVHDQETGVTYQVVNGDTHDFRPLDKQPEGASGVVVGLKNKDATKHMWDAPKLSNGFFVHYDPKAKNGVPTNRSVVIPPQPSRSAALGMHTNDVKS